MNKEFKVDGIYSDKRGNKWKITGNDNVGCFPLEAVCPDDNSPNYFKGALTDFTTDGGYQEDEASDHDLIYQDQSDYALLEFKRKCNLFNTIAGKSGVPTEDDLKNQVRLVTEEAKELLDAFVLTEYTEEPDYTDVLQELTDVLVVSSGLLEQFKALGYNTDKALKLVADTNLSKFTQDKKQAYDSKEYYNECNEGVTVDYNEQERVYVLKDKNNKVRKPLSFKKVNLEQCKP